MTQPKQIIYPLRYVRPLVSANRESATRFKENFDKFLGGGVSVIPLGRARSGIFVLVKLSVTNQRRAVILSPYTIPDVINMVRFAGGDPVFVDCIENSTNIDIDHLAQLVNGDTACVLITHYHVNQNHTANIIALCQERGVACFDDCAISLGAELSGARIGTVTDASIFSLSSFKTLNFFWGGAITTRSSDLAARVRVTVENWPRLKMRQYRAQIIKTLKYDPATKPALFSNIVFPILRKKISKTEVEDILPVTRIESPSLDDTITSRPSFSAVTEWNRKIPSVDWIVRHRRHIAAIYNSYFGRRAVSPETAQDIRAGSGYANYPVFVRPEIRNNIYKEILACGFDVGLSLYPNVHETPGFTEITGRSSNVSALVRSVITLPTHPKISTAYAHELACTVNSVFSRHGLN